MQCNVVQYSYVQCISVPCSAVLCSAVKSHTILQNVYTKQMIRYEFSPHKIGCLHLDRFYVAGLLAQWHKQLGWVKHITEIILSYALDNAPGFANFTRLNTLEYDLKYVLIPIKNKH